MNKNEDRGLKDLGYTGSFQGTFRVYSGRSRFIELKDPLGFITSPKLKKSLTLLGGGLSFLEDQA